MKKTTFLFAVLTFFVGKNNAQTVTDIDGNIYNTVTIGTQIWLKENLKVTHYRNGDSIPNVIYDTLWFNLSSGAYCDYNNSPVTSLTYGKLYNWYAINDIRNICPMGWHVATEADWTLLMTYLGGENIAGGKLKEEGTLHWKIPNIGATNESGFTGLPGGHRDSDSGRFAFIGLVGIWWSSSESGTWSAWSHYIENVMKVEISLDFKYKSSGFSVRCIKDSLTQINKINYQEKIKIFPNPVQDKVNINCIEKLNQKMQLFNTLGQCVLQKELNKNFDQIDISFLTKGIYILKLTSTYGTYEKKIIKE
jgi:uncharacterized protein (TIGR02145 family)